MYRSTYRLPHMCARCASDDPTDTYEISSTPFFYNLTTFFSTRTFKFNIPVCSRCLHELNNIRTTKTIITILAVIIGGAIGYYTTYDGVALFFGAFLGMIAGAIIGGSIEYVMEGNIGSYSGYKYKFRNKEFMKAFQDLNPHL